MILRIVSVLETWREGESRHCGLLFLIRTGATGCVFHVSIGQLETNSTPTYQGDGPAKEPVRHVRMAAHCRNLGERYNVQYDKLGIFKPESTCHLACGTLYSLFSAFRPLYLALN